MRTQLVVMFLSAGVAASAFSASAMAGPPGVTGSIDLATDLSRISAPQYGGDVAFSAVVAGRMESKAYTYITTVCQQDGRVVYQWSSRDLNFAFPLTDQNGQGLEWSGGAATCEAALVYRVDRKNGATIQTLDSVAFDVSG
jgi:hypothetical protein